ncbi:hypothetical protein MLD38_040786 [Melastoma candidum]|nr:hypothetical protein MLD38_040915 [Melastoma candidum]KAI4294932.1 hypothetical protein MLD38_040786 [Melastoma candidum]
MALPSSSSSSSLRPTATARSLLPGSRNLPRLSSLPMPVSIFRSRVRASAGCPPGGEEEKVAQWREMYPGRKVGYSVEKPPTPLLDTVNYPAHMKNLGIQDLEQLAAELREETLYTVSQTGGHLGSSLGVLSSPSLSIMFLTPRKTRLYGTSAIRPSWVSKRDESVYDAFGAGHSSTSISAGLGMAVGRDLLGKTNNVISIIGDGAMTAGQAYEAMNNAGYLDTNLIVVLNDNKQVSLPTATLDGPATPVGALSSALTKLQASTNFRKLREAAKTITKQIGGQTHEVAAKVDEYARE